MDIIEISKSFSKQNVKGTIRVPNTDNNSISGGTISEKGGSSPPPPTGKIICDAMLLPIDPTLDAKAMNAENETEPLDILGGDIRLSVITKDPYTGEVIQLNNIPVRKTPGTILEGIQPGQRFRLECVSYEAFKDKDTTLMEVYPTGSPPVIQNKALPTPVKNKNEMDSFSSKPTPICKQFNVMEEQAKRRLGIVYDRDDVTIVQGKDNGRSPGILIHQNDGKIYMFDSSGKQHIALDGERVQIQASEIDHGSAKVGVDMAGFPIPMEENQMNNFVVQGTIVSPQTKLIPNVIKTINTISSIVGLIELVVACKKAVDIMRD